MHMDSSLLLREEGDDQITISCVWGPGLLKVQPLNTPMVEKSNNSVDIL